MSSGKIERNFYENIQNSLISDDSSTVAASFLQKRSEFESESLKNSFNIKIRSDHENIEKRMKDDHFNIIEEIHFILKNSPNLTQNQKLAYCKDQRLFMKLYLQLISKKIDI